MEAEYSMDDADSRQVNRKPTYKGKVVVVGDFASGKTSLLHRYQAGSYLGIQEPTIAAAFSTKIVDLEITGEPPHIIYSVGEPGVQGRSLRWAAAGAVATADSSQPTAASAATRIKDEREASPVHAPLACRVKLELWDTAGSERYNSLMPMYFRDALVALIVFDPSRRSSFERVTRWMESYRAHNEGSTNDPHLRAVLVCAKSDLFAERSGHYCDPSVEFGGPDKGNEPSVSMPAPGPSQDRVQVSLAEVQQFAQAQSLPLVFTSAKANWNVEVLFRDVATHIALVAQLRERAAAAGGKSSSRFGLRNGIGTFGGSPTSLMLAEDPLQREFDSRGERRPKHAAVGGRKQCEC